MIFQAVSVTAIGYYGNINELPKDIAEVEIRPRERKELKDIIFNNKFGESYEL